MAERVIRQLVSDLSGEDIKPGKGRTVSFSFDGADYTIDLTDKEFAAFQKAVSPYADSATKVRMARRSRSARPQRSAQNLSDVRHWAKANGYNVSDRGRIAQEVVAAFEAANLAVPTASRSSTCSPSGNVVALHGARGA